MLLASRAERPNNLANRAGVSTSQGENTEVHGRIRQAGRRGTWRASESQRRPCPGTVPYPNLGRSTNVKCEKKSWSIGWFALLPNDSNARNGIAPAEERTAAPFNRKRCTPHQLSRSTGHVRSFIHGCGFCPSRPKIPGVRFLALHAEPCRLP